MLTLEEIVNKAREIGIPSQELGCGLLNHPEILQAYLEGAVIEQYHNKDGWHVDDSPSFGSYRNYRVKPLEFEHWDAVSPEYKWLCMNKEGNWFIHKHEPQRFSGVWVSVQRVGGICVNFLNTPKCSDWEQSLIKRPE